MSPKSESLENHGNTHYLIAVLMKMIFRVKAQFCHDLKHHIAKQLNKLLLTKLKINGGIQLNRDINAKDNVKEERHLRSSVQEDKEEIL